MLQLPITEHDVEALAIVCEYSEAAKKVPIATSLAVPSHIYEGTLPMRNGDFVGV